MINSPKNKASALCGVLANLIIGELDRIQVKPKHKELKALCLRLQGANVELTESQQLALFTVANAVESAVKRKPPKARIEIYAAAFNWTLEKINLRSVYKPSFIRKIYGEKLAKEVFEAVEIQA